MANVKELSREQFQQLIDALHALAPKQQPAEEPKSKGSFGNCQLTFYGQTDTDAVEEFITAVESYKDVEGISDADALKGISLLFRSQAIMWWKGVRREAKTWEDALTLLRDHFSPTKPPYQLYMELFEEKQSNLTPIDTFICQKRAILAKLPEGLHDEETELNFIYGLLNVKYRQLIARHDVKTFRDLLEKGRKIEQNKL